MTQKSIKAQALADHLAENPVDEEYKPLKTYFHDEEVSFAGEDISETYPDWRLFFDGAANHQACILGLKMIIDLNVYELLVIGDSDLLIHQVLGEWAVKNSKIIPYNELADALATIASMIKHPDTDYIDPLDVELKEHPIHCSHVESEPDGLPWYFDIKRYLESGTYPEDAILIRRSRYTVHVGVCGTHMNGLNLSRKVL
nr:uncharacterized protein LOC104646489 [Solanum lycopersicum]